MGVFVNHTTFTIERDLPGSPARRIIYAYAMNTGSVQMSAALATVEFVGKRGRCKMTYTEQAVFLDPSDAAGRSRGTEMGFERLSLAIESNLAPLH